MSLKEKATNAARTMGSTLASLFNKASKFVETKTGMSKTMADFTVATAGATLGSALVLGTGVVGSLMVGSAVATVTTTQAGQGFAMQAYETGKDWAQYAYKRVTGADKGPGPSAG